MKMNIEQLRSKIEALRSKIDGFKVEAKTATSERLLQIEEESRNAETEMGTLNTQLREALANRFGQAPVIQQQQPGSTEIDQRIAKMKRKSALAEIIGRGFKKQTFSESEKRALGVALTTTAETYVAATELVDGVNNAGVFIPTSVVLDLLREEGLLSPILRDISFTSIPGLVEFVFRKSRDKAKSKAEGATGKDNQMEWDKVTGVKGYLQTIIPVTDEVQALTAFDFGAYIIDQLIQDLNEDWVYDLIYGAGNSDHIKGITVGALAAVTGGYDAGKEIDALIAGLAKLTPKFRRNAKIYVATDVYDKILFSTDDNGNFKYPVFNNSTGISSFGSVRVETDENLTAGDFIIGNVTKYFKANSLIPIRIETDRFPRRGVTEYVASEYCATAPVPNAFVHGVKK
jgi:HK97 family phage major capsid protein